MKALSSPGMLACAIVAMAVACDNPTGPSRCTAVVENRCWTQLGPNNQWIIAVKETEWGLYAGTAYDGVFWLNPATLRWEALGLDHAIVSSIVFQPGPTKRLLVGVMPQAEEQTQAAVFASDDRGRTWRPWDGGFAARRGNRGWAYGLAIDPGNPDRLYVDYGGVLGRSEDGGQTWRIVSESEKFIGCCVLSAIVVSPARDGTVWAAGETSLFTGILVRTRDWGDSWGTFKVDPRAGTPVYEDNGVLSLTVDPSNTDRLFAGMKNGFLVRSEDAGATWRPVFRSKDISAFLYGVAYVGRTVYVAALENFRPPPDGRGPPVTDLALYRSRDHGATWETLGVPPAVKGGAHTLAVDAQGNLLIGTRNSGVWRVEIER